MFLVKSCNQEYNVKNSKTIKIGTLHEYRETESLQIVDKEEGYLHIYFDLHDKYINVNLFNHLNHVHNSDLKADTKFMGFNGRYLNNINITLDAKYTWMNNNRFIFCISKLENHEESINIFPDYDDYWYISYFKKDMIIKKIEESLFKEVKKLTSSGFKIFNKDSINIENLMVKSYSQDIIYTERELFVNNLNIEESENDLIGIFKNIKYIKPEIYSKEKEFRIVFDFYENDVLLTPIVKSITIPESISDIIRQQY